MNPSYPGSSGERHGPPPAALNASTSSAMGAKSGAPPHSYHPAPTISQLTHSTHASMHPLHGGGSSMLHAGPPPLPPPPLGGGLGVPSSSRSPHHPLGGSILHPPRGGPLGGGVPGGPSVLSKPPSSQGGPTSSAGAGVLLGHPGVRMQPQGMSQGLGNPQSVSSISNPGGLKPPGQSYSVRPPSPRRDLQPQSTQHPGQQQVQMQQQQQPQQQPQQQQPQQYILERTSEADDNSGYYGPGQSSMGPPQNQQPRHRELRVEDALLYLDQVKQQFGDQPDIYNQFLDVMKDFKAQAIDTPGVILRVSSLFRGYPTLILGFNTFLPPGYRIRPDTTIEVISSQIPGRGPGGGNGPPMYGSMSGSAPGSQSGGGMGPPGHRPPPVNIPQPQYGQQDIGSQHKMPMQSRLAPSQPSMKGMVNGRLPKHKTQQQQQQQQQASAGGGGNASRNSANPVEFDHAIHYVTTIKQRFADEPETYKEFLAILHTYQKEQRSIRQVLDQVSHLFRDHPDLLREFTFFLPDQVQKQATERLNRAAKEAEARRDMMNKAKYGQRDSYPGGQGMYQGQMQGMRRDDGRGMRAGADSPSDRAAMKGSRGMMMDDGSMMSTDDYRGKKSKDLYKHGDDRRLSGKALERREKERERERNRALFEQKRAKRRPYDGKERRSYLALSDVLLDKEEWSIFERIKKILPSRENWREFLKCLELYSQEVLGRDEMLSLIRNLFGRHTDLVEEFDQMICSHGVQSNPKEVWPFIPLAETDLSQCRRATPSYRGLPASYPIPPCSSRSKLERSVCNDEWVSVPTGSEDFSFKSMRKNQYEEALFKCEDERFEIDMVIEANTSTISLLEPLAREIDVLKEKEGSDDKLWNYVVDKGTFRTTHLNAITRIYGEAGSQILELLRKYPAGAIPIILKRLKQKDEEWRRAREDLNKQWKEVNEKNFHKSLDHSSFYFKQKDKKQTSMKVLLQEAKKKLELDEKTTTDGEAKADVASIKNASQLGEKAAPRASEIADALNKEHANAASSNVESASASASSSANATPLPNLSLSALPATATSEPTPSSTTPDWKPHFKFKISSVQIHKDAFGLLSYAAEKNLSVADKEKVSKIWQGFYFPFFQMEEEWLVRKPKQTTVTLEKSKTLRVGTEVSTEFGEGTLQSFNAAKGYHVVNLPIGQAYLQPEAISIEEASDFPPSLPVLDDKRDAARFIERNTSRFYGSQHAYAFLRLYQMLHNRLDRARELCEKAKRNRHRRTVNPAIRALEPWRHPLANDTAAGKEKAGDYQAFVTKLYGLIDGTIDNTKYEDCCRSLMGSTSYFLFTMDKLVAQVLKQMQHLATDDTCQELLKLFAEQQELKQDATPEAAAAYLAKTKTVFEGEGAFRIEFNPGVLRRTPLEQGALTPSGADVPGNKIWAPSPRVKPQEPSKWLVEPELAMEYLGSMDDDGDDDDDESPSATPPDTPSATPLFGSPEREQSDENAGKADESGVEHSGDDSANALSEEEQLGASLLDAVSKKRPRAESGDEADAGAKKSKVEDEEPSDDVEEGEVQDDDEAMEDASVTPASADDEPMKEEAEASTSQASGDDSTSPNADAVAESTVKTEPSTAEVKLEPASSEATTTAKEPSEEQKEDK